MAPIGIPETPKGHDGSLETLTSLAQECAEKYNVPFLVTWKGREYFPIPVIARDYNASEHGCIERIRYSRNYKYPYDADAVLKGAEMW